MRQALLQPALECPADGNKRVDDLFMARGEVVVVIRVAVQDLDHRATAVERRRQSQLQQIVGNQHTLARWNDAAQAPQDGVEILDRRPVLEDRLVIRVEVPAEPRVCHERADRANDAIGERVGPSMAKQPFHHVQHAAERIRDDADDARRRQRRHARTCIAQTGAAWGNGDGICGGRHGSDTRLLTSKTNPASESSWNTGPVCRCAGSNS